MSTMIVVPKQNMLSKRYYRTNWKRWISEDCFVNNVLLRAYKKDVWEAHRGKLNIKKRKSTEPSDRTVRSSKVPKTSEVGEKRGPSSTFPTTDPENTVKKDVDIIADDLSTAISDTTAVVTACEIMDVAMLRSQAWTEEYLIPSEIFELDSWDDFVVEVGNIDNKVDPKNIIRENYRVTLVWKSGILDPQLNNKTILSLAQVRLKCKERLLDFFLKHCHFKQQQ
ncbi:hypothetical protein BDR26DRAFT_498743 [Obelidium mucronatum]|nr:hypothetical protein BDR26DRAFT_498743 [Obelidium mucronatum]